MLFLKLFLKLVLGRKFYAMYTNYAELNTCHSVSHFGIHIRSSLLSLPLSLSPIYCNQIIVYIILSWNENWVIVIQDLFVNIDFYSLHLASVINTLMEYYFFFVHCHSKFNFLSYNLPRAFNFITNKCLSYFVWLKYIDSRINVTDSHNLE